MGFYELLASSTESLDLTTITYTEFEFSSTDTLEGYTVGIFHIPFIFFILFIGFTLFIFTNIFWRFKKKS